MTQSQDQDGESDMADTCVRLDFIWETPYTGKFNRVAGGVKTGSMQHCIYNVAAELRDNAVHIGIVTTLESINDTDMSEFESECRREMNAHLDVDDEWAGTCDELHVSAVYLGEAEDARPIRSTHPRVHFSINERGCPNTVDAEVIEKHIRKTFQKRVDVERAGNGFNLLFREPTVTQSAVNEIKQFIVEKENVRQQSIATVFIAPESTELP